MIENSKKVLVASLFLGVTLSASTLEDYNQLIASTNVPEAKQVFLCEREAVHIRKDPQECIKAAIIPKNRAVYGVATTYEDYQATMLVNASEIYKVNSEYIEAVKMLKKALKISPNYALPNLNMGVLYYLGQGVEMNKYKAYEYFSIAAKQGDENAQKGLDILCGESPWACK